MEEMKFYTEEEMLDKHIGKVGTPHRTRFEDEVNTFLEQHSHLNIPTVGQYAI